MVRQLWPLLAGGLGIGIGILLWSAPGGPTILRFLPPVGVALLTVLCFRDWVRQDRIGFISVIGPAFVVAVASTLAPPPWWSLTGAIPILFLALFIFDSPARPWWWQHILRRPLPTAAQTSEYRLGVAWKAWIAEFRGQGPSSEKVIAAGHKSLDRLREIELPDPDWSGLRDAYVDLAARRMAIAQDGMSPEDQRAFQEEFLALETRRRDLRLRGTQTPSGPGESE
jgi:hypothetical protein